MKRLILVVAALAAAVGNAATYYIDSERGDDAADGLTPQTAWRSLARVKAHAAAPDDRLLFKRGGLWRGELRISGNGEPGRPIYVGAYGTGAKPILQNSLDFSDPAKWEDTAPGIWASRREVEIPRDVGIFICDHGRKWGVKKWKLGELENPLDYWYDADAKRVYVRHDGNPGAAYQSVELAIWGTIVSHGGRHDLVFDGLMVRYTGAHGFGGANAKNITIRNCDICWIGGSLQFWRDDRKGGREPVRFGNGIEFWLGCDHCLVERNRIWQIYDAALTNQAKGHKEPISHDTIVYRDNVIWQAEYSFEFWNREKFSTTRNILFEHNTCVDAGYGWAHDQRPDHENGAHLMFYHNVSPATNVIVRNNLFVRTKDRSTRMMNDWRHSLTLDSNLYWIPENKIFEAHWKNNPLCFGAGEEAFKDYQAATGMDMNSVYGEPQFVDERCRDYRLKPGSFGTDLATDGGPIGARGMPGFGQMKGEKK